MKKLAALLAVFTLGTTVIVGETFAQIVLSSGGVTRLVESAYIVYDQTGKSVGTTKDGIEVFARFSGHEGKVFRFSVYGSELQTASGLRKYYFEPDCVGQPFYEVYGTPIAGVERHRVIRGFYCRAVRGDSSGLLR
jgi:hypothetical protein